MSALNSFRGIFERHCARSPFADRLQGDLVNLVEVYADQAWSGAPCVDAFIRDHLADCFIADPQIVGGLLDSAPAAWSGRWCWFLACH